MPGRFSARRFLPKSARLSLMGRYFFGRRGVFSPQRPCPYAWVESFLRAFLPILLTIASMDRRFSIDLNNSFSVHLPTTSDYPHIGRNLSPQEVYISCFRENLHKKASPHNVALPAPGEIIFLHLLPYHFIFIITLIVWA